MDCQSVQEKLTLYLYEELEGDERAAVAAHLGGCAACRQGLEELGRLRAVLDQRPAWEPSPELMVRCREALEEALDREATSWGALVRGWFEVPRGVAALRLTTALTILVVGFSLGWALRQRGAVPGPAAVGQPTPAWVGSDLADVRINRISQVAPGPETGAVHITLDAERRVTLEGSFDDPRIQQVLLFAMKNYQNPGIRRDTLAALREQGNNPTAREALLYALRKDPNAGVRLEAVEAVRGIEWSPEIHLALLEALRQDTNPGVRVAAVEVLTEHADKEFLPVLEELAANDRNPYVRLKCAKAVRELARDDF